jgi:hypothetical protein
MLRRPAEDPRLRWRGCVLPPVARTDIDARKFTLQNGFGELTASRDRNDASH